MIRTLAEVEREAVLAAITEAKGNRTHAARGLGIAIRTLRLKLAQYREQGHTVPCGCAFGMAPQYCQCRDLTGAGLPESS